MKHFYIAGNWKSYKGVNDAAAWVDKFAQLYKEKPFSPEVVTVVLCPPFTLLSQMSADIKKHNLPITLGSQDVSPYDEGAYTGEVNAKQLSEFVGWTIIGHSERRRNLGETDELLAHKVTQAKAAGLSVIYCVQDEAVIVPETVDVIGYEPPWAISAVSGGVAQNVESANRVCEKIRIKYPHIPVIYGGSATPENVSSFVSQSAISGVLPGGASMDPEKFFAMISALSNHADEATHAV